jgi:transposase, IS6 family
VLWDGGSEVSGRPRTDCSLAPFVDGFGQQLLALGYASGTVGNQLAVAGQLGRWMASRGLRVDQLGRSEIDAFVNDCRRPGARQVVFRRGLVLLREHLIDVGAVPAEPPAVRSALDELIGSCRAWLLRERGLAEATVRRYEATARRFLAQRTGGVDVHDLSATEVSAFLLAESSRCSVGAAKGHVAELRLLLRYLFVTGRRQGGDGGLVANSTSSGTPAAVRRCRSSAQPLGRYKARSISACHCGAGVGQIHSHPKLAHRGSYLGRAPRVGSRTRRSRECANLGRPGSYNAENTRLRSGYFRDLGPSQGSQPSSSVAARPSRHATGDRSFVNDTYVKVAGRWTHLYRAINQRGQVIDVLVSERRDGAAARAFLTRAMTVGRVPREITTDRAAVYPRVFDDLAPSARHVVDQYANNVVEEDHGRLKARLLPMRGLKKIRSARTIAAGHAFVQNLRRARHELTVHVASHDRVQIAFVELALGL